MTPAVCGALALAALGAGFGLVQWLYTRRLLARLDRMLAGAVDGSFRESRFDESRLSPWRAGWPGFSTAAPPRPGSWRGSGPLYRP